MRLLYIIFGIIPFASFTCYSFHSIDSWTLSENYGLKNPLAKVENVFDIFASPIVLLNLE